MYLCVLIWIVNTIVTFSGLRCKSKSWCSEAVCRIIFTPSEVDSKTLISRKLDFISPVNLLNEYN